MNGHYINEVQIIEARNNKALEIKVNEFLTKYTVENLQMQYQSREGLSSVFISYEIKRS